MGGGGQSSQLTVSLNPGQTEEGPWGVGVGAVYPQVPEEGAPDGGREITFHGLNYSWRGQRPPTREILWGWGAGAGITGVHPF